MTERIQLCADVPSEMDNERLDQVAAKLFPDYSRSRLQTWIKKGDLLVDGKQLRTRDKVFHGAQLSIDTEPEQAVGWQPQNIDLDIIYEDAHILVVNKPAGLVVHPAAGHPDGTLVNALLAHSPEMAQLPRGGIVHRLDMETLRHYGCSQEFVGASGPGVAVTRAYGEAGICRGVYWCNDRRWYR